MSTPQPTRTLITYAHGAPWIRKSKAYCTVDDGATWGPLRPYFPFPERHEIGPGAAQIPMNPGESLEDAVREKFPGNAIEEPALHVGQYYPRIWRGGEAYIDVGDFVPCILDTPYLNSFIGSLEQIESLFDSLSSVFRVAHPAPDNLSTYGGAIRDLIILACTEVEAQWKGVLRANSIFAPADSYNTNHYVRLLPVMRLNEYRVKLVRYPGLSEITPFGTWNPSQPTGSLTWYDVYNRVKHDREANFTDASLEHAVHAVAACVVMIAAQFGERTLRSYRFENLFQFTNIPMWEPRDWYYEPIPRVLWVAVDCPM